MLELLKSNFQAILTALGNNQLSIIIIALIICNGYFIKQWTDAKEDCDKRVFKIEQQKDSISAISFDRLIKLYDLQTMNERRTQVIDSVVKEKIVKPIEKNK